MRWVRRVRPILTKIAENWLLSTLAFKLVPAPTELAAESGYIRDAIYKWEGQGLRRATGGKGFTMSSVLAFIGARERAAGRVVDEDVDQALTNLAAAHVDPESDDRHPYLGGVNVDGRA